MRLLHRNLAYYRILTPEDYLVNQRRASLLEDLYVRKLKPLPKANQGPSDTTDEVKLMAVAKGVIQKRSTWAYLPDKFLEIAQDHGMDLVFVQVDPSEYIARERFIAHKCALGKVEDYREDGVELIDPICPLSFQETVVNPLSLDMIVGNTLPKETNYRGGFYTYYHSSLQTPEVTKQITPLFIDTIGKIILGGKRTEYPIIDRILYTALTGKHKVMLGGIPETLYKLILGNGLSLNELKDIFRTVIQKNNQLTIPFETKDAAENFMPHIFQLPKDLYMTALLRQAFQAATQVVAGIGIEHLVPIQNYWISPPYGINMTEATAIPQNIPGQSVEDMIEKQAILDVLLQTRTWSKSYLANPFPYLFQDITQVDKQHLEACKVLFLKHYRKYSDLKRREFKTLSASGSETSTLKKLSDGNEKTEASKKREQEMAKIANDLSNEGAPSLSHTKKKLTIRLDSRRSLSGEI